MKDKLSDLIGILILGLLILIGVGLIVFTIILLIKYGNTPLAELPSWVAWWLNRN